MAIKMVDIGAKEKSFRSAVACVKVKATKRSLDLMRRSKLRKGDALDSAHLAGILAAKKTAELIPLCHQVNLSSVEILFKFKPAYLEIQAHCRAFDSTGVEMEALLACSVAALTVYDMLKAHERGIVISDLKLLKKRGGSSGDYILR